MYMIFVFVSPDYELIVDSDILPNRTVGSGWTTGGFESQEPAQFEERHLIFLQQLGKVWRSVETGLFRANQPMLISLDPLSSCNKFAFGKCCCDILDFYSRLIKLRLHDSGISVPLN